MTCQHFCEDLIAFQLGELEDPARRALEAHLVDCSACVREFVTLKRQLELADVVAVERPSNVAAHRLRRAVVAQVSPAPPAWVRPVSWLVASAAALAAMVFVGTFAHYESVPAVLVSRIAH